ncbi:MAG TPA: D-alanine--D-alanine ligase [Candidatus Eremiobacteraceae bacterium]|nr:D-alanine--D-alanine ligase [Candidatus Eremiobacteraceae bacterium]
MSKPTIAVLMGGSSAEREISLQTGMGVSATLEGLGYITYSLEYDDTFVDRLRERRPDAVFIALHGGSGEDGSVQAILDWMRLPYQGSGVRASAVAMDKEMTKALMLANGIPTPVFSVFEASAPLPTSPPSELGCPCVVKPSAQGSSVGVSIVSESADWADAIAGASKFGGRILVEQYIPGREFTAAILEEQPLPIVEIIPNDDSYSYAAKYTPGGSTHKVPAQVDASLAMSMQDYAMRLHSAVGARDYSRTDFLLDEHSGIFALECNTLPGLTAFSLFPEAAAAAGISYAALVERLVRSALARTAVAG